MKFIKEEIADPKGKAKRRYLLALGRNEVEFILGLVENFLAHSPRGLLKIQPLLARARDIQKALQDAKKNKFESEDIDDND